MSHEERRRAAQAALDAAGERDLFARLRTLTEGKIALFISHRFSTVRMADRILVLERGRLVAQGTHEQLLRSSPLYAAIVESQLRGETVQRPEGTRHAAVAYDGGL